MSRINTFENPWDENDKRNKDDNIKSIEELIKKGRERFFKTFANGNNQKNDKNTTNNGESNTKIYKSNSLILAILLLSLWLLSGFFTVDTNEEGIILFFGKYNRTTTPGLNYHIPYPFESVEKINVTRLNREVIGLKALQEQNPNNFKSNEMRRSFNFTDSRPSQTENNRSQGVEQISERRSSSTDEEHMLTGDENMIDLQFFVQWYVKDAKSYLFNVKDELTENTVKSVAESAMRQVIGSVKLYDALSEKRELIERLVKEILQKTLDSYHAGVQIESLGILYSYVAPEVMDAYRDVQSAKADKEREINSAYAYRNDIIPRARGEAAAIIEKANAYNEAVIVHAKGEASRYTAVFEQYKDAKEVTKQRLYIDTITKILGRTNKVLFDQKLSNGSTLLPIIGVNDLIQKGEINNHRLLQDKNTSSKTNTDIVTKEVN